MDISDEVRNLLKQSEAMRTRWSTSLTTPQKVASPPLPKAGPGVVIPDTSSSAVNNNIVAAPSLSSAPTEASMASTFTPTGPSNASVAAWVQAYSDQMLIPEIRVGSLAGTNADEEEEEMTSSSSHSSSSSGRSPQYVDSILTPAPSVLREVSRSDTAVFSDPSSSITSRPATNISTSPFQHQQYQKPPVLSAPVLDGVLTRQKSPKPVYRGSSDTGGSGGGGFSKSVSNDDTPYPSITISSRPEVMNAYNRGGGNSAPPPTTQAQQQPVPTNTTSDSPSSVAAVVVGGDGSSYDGIADRYVVSYDTSLNGSVHNEDGEEERIQPHRPREKPATPDSEAPCINDNSDHVTVQKPQQQPEQYSGAALQGHVDSSSLIKKTKSMTQTTRTADNAGVAPIEIKTSSPPHTIAQKQPAPPTQQPTTIPREVVAHTQEVAKPVDLLLECRMAVEGVRAQLVARYSSPTPGSSRRGRSGSPGGRRSVGSSRSTRSKHGDIPPNTEPRHNSSRHNNHNSSSSHYQRRTSQQQPDTYEIPPPSTQHTTNTPQPPSPKQHIETTPTSGTTTNPIIPVRPVTPPNLQHSSADSSLSMLEKSPNTTFSKAPLDDLPTTSEGGINIGNNNNNEGGGVGGPTMEDGSGGGHIGGSRRQASPVRRPDEVTSTTTSSSTHMMNGRNMPRDDVSISRRGQRRSVSPPRRGVEPTIPDPLPQQRPPITVEPVHRPSDHTPQVAQIMEEEPTDDHHQTPHPIDIDDDDDFEKDFYLGYDEPTTTSLPPDDTTTIVTSKSAHSHDGGREEVEEHQPPHISRKKNNAASTSEPSSKQQQQHKGGGGVTTLNDSLVYHLSSKNASMASPTTIGAIAASAAAEVAAGGGGILGSMGSNDGSFTPFKIEDLLPPISPLEEVPTTAPLVSGSAPVEHLGTSYALMTSGEQTAPTSPAAPSFKQSYAECTPISSSVPLSPTSLTEHPSPSFRPSFKQPSYAPVAMEAPLIEVPTPPTRSPLVSSPVPSWKVAPPQPSFQSAPQEVTNNLPQNPPPPPTDSATTTSPPILQNPAVVATIVASDSNRRSSGGHSSPMRNATTTTPQRRQNNSSVTAATSPSIGGGGGVSDTISRVDGVEDVPLSFGGVNELGITPSGAALHPGVRPPRSPARRQSDSTSPQRSSRPNNSNTNTTPQMMPEISLPSPTTIRQSTPPSHQSNSQPQHQHQRVFGKVNTATEGGSTRITAVNGVVGGSSAPASGGGGGLTAAQVKAAHEKSKIRKEWKRKRLGELYSMQIMVELARLSGTEVSSRLDLCREEEGCRADIGQDMMMMMRFR